MSNRATLLGNVALLMLSVIFVLLLSLGADYVVGVILRPPHLPETMELIYPPFAEQHFETNEFHYSVYVNSLGFRDRELPRERENAYRIVVIGDSYTYGWGVDIEDTWMRMLEADLRNEGYEIEILNLGKPGVGPPFYAELAEKALPVLRPDLVIVAMLQGNDMRAAGPDDVPLITKDAWDHVRAIYPNISRLMRDMRRERTGHDRTHQDMPPQVTTADDNRNWTVNTARQFHENMKPEQRARFDALEDTVREAFLNGDLNPYLVDLALQVPDFYTMAIDPEDPWTQVSIERTAGFFSRIKYVAEQYGGRMIVVSVPEGPYVNAHAMRNMARVGYEMPKWLLDTDGADEVLAEASNLAESPFYSVTPVFREHEDDPELYFELDGHPTPKGNRLFADAFKPMLKEVIDTDAPRRH